MCGVPGPASRWGARSPKTQQPTLSDCQCRAGYKRAQARDGGEEGIWLVREGKCAERERVLGEDGGMACRMAAGLVWSGRMQQSSDAGLQVCLAARARRGRAPPWNLTGQGCLAARLAQSGQHPSGGSQSHRASRGGGKGTCRSTPYPTPGAVSAQPSSAQSARHCSGTLHTGRAQARVKGAPRRTFSALADGMPPLRGGGRERWRLLQVRGRVASLGGPKSS